MSVSKLTHVYVGNLAEADACTFLQGQGLRLLERNFKIKTGEIDLVMQDGDYVVFVEVKMRTHEKYGSAIEVISSVKQSRIIRAATFYLLKQHQYFKARCRFDVVGISPHKKIRRAQKITWIRDAFRVK